jgi:glutamine amidotransferase
MIAIMDYGMGNLRSVQKAFQKVGAEAVVTDEREIIESARAVVLPGVGAFGDAMTNLRSQGLVETIERVVERGTPLLGICLGLQLFFEESDEMGLHQGLGLFPGRVRRFDVGLKVPHIGWNQVHIRRQSPLLDGLADGSYAYFVHSYCVEPNEDDDILATTDYGLDFASVVGRNNVYGIQFHPEKSQDVGMRILGNFVTMMRVAAKTSKVRHPE